MSPPRGGPASLTGEERASKPGKGWRQRRRTPTEEESVGHERTGRVRGPRRGYEPNAPRGGRIIYGRKET